MSELRQPLRRRDCFLGVHLDLHPSWRDRELGADITEQMLADFLDKVKPDFVQYDCKGHSGWSGYQTKIASPSPGIVQDSLALWREATARRGIGLYIHYSGVWDSRAVALHPEWGRCDKNGELDGKNTSVFGPYVDELLIPQLKEAAGRYSLDGAWIDGECWSVAPDYSDMARQAWKERTGKDKLPQGPGDEDWAEFMEFNRQGFRDYLRHYIEQVHAEFPDFQIASNWFYTSFAPEPEELPVDFISGDYSPGGSVDFARLEARYLSSTGKPWDLMAWGFNRGEGLGKTNKTAVQLKQEAAVVLAQGGGFQIYYQPTRAGWLDPWITDIIADVVRFCRCRQELCHKSKTVPQVAILNSSATFYQKSDQAGRLFAPWAGQTVPVQGALHAFLALGYSVDVLAEHHLKGRIADYPVLVLPECTRLEEDFLQELKDYLHEGGSLLLIGAETSRFFEEELDVSFHNSPQEQAAQIRFGDTMAAVNGSWQAVKTRGAHVIATLHPDTDPRRGGDTAATWTTAGKGRIAGVYGPLATVYYNSHVPVLRDLLGELMKAVFPHPAVEISAPGCIDVSLRKKNGELLLHLANVSGRQNFSREAVVDYIPPVAPFEVRMRLDKAPSALILEPEGEELQYTWDNGITTFRVPGVDIHSIVRVL